MKKPIIIFCIWLAALVLVSVWWRGRSEDITPSSPQPGVTQTTPDDDPRIDPIKRDDVIIGVDGQPLDKPKKPDPVVGVNDIPDEVSISRGLVDWPDLSQVDKISQQVAIVLTSYDPRSKNADVTKYLTGDALTLYEQLASNVGDYSSRPVPKSAVKSINVEDRDGRRFVYVTVRVKEGSSASDRLVTLEFVPNKTLVNYAGIELAY